MYKGVSSFPRQALPLSKKTTEWRKDCVRYADQNTILSSSLIRKSVAHKKINYDLLSGKLNMADLEVLNNPENIDYGVPTKKIQHYPIINNKINLLLGEERDSQFDFRVIVTNPNSLSEIEENKKREVQQKVQALVEDESLSEEEYAQKMEKLSDFFTYEWQDLREIRANCLLNHYKKEQNFDGTFNDGFGDALAVNEEIYQCTIEGEEPILRKLNPMKVYLYGSGYSSKVEDADMIVIEDYWPLGRIMDTYYKKLSKADVEKLEELGPATSDERGDKGDPRNALRFGDYIDQIKDFDEGGWVSFTDGVTSKDLPYDIEGNIRVLQVYWKSLRRIKEVKSYNPETGEAEYDFKTENYIPNKDLGEETTNYYVNEAWHGVMIGSGENAIFIDMGPCPIQYNSMSNPSKCHFGIIGTIYNINESTPYSMVDMMKPLQYMYDVMHDRLNKLLARNMGKILQLNLSMIPAGWSVEKWMYYIKANGIALVDPTREGKSGKPAGAFNPAPVFDVELGNSIQAQISFLEYLKEEMTEIVGITKQRQGQISNRETVGGVERATLQSSHTTRWYFAKHEDTKKRVLECFLETAKIAMKGHTKKFNYILPDHSQQLMTIEGDMFAENDYGLVVDNGYDMQALNQEIQQIAQAAMQNNALTFSTYLKIRSNCSMAEKVKMIENDEKRAREMAQQAQQQQMQAEEAKAQADMQMKQQELTLKDLLNQRDNETKLMLANIQALASQDSTGDGIVDNIDKEKLDEQIREFNAKMTLEKDKLQQEDKHHKEDLENKLTVARMKPKTPSK